MSDSAKPGLLPPRPNLGPEPLAEPSFLSPVVLAIILAGLVVLVVLVWRKWSRRRESSIQGHAESRLRQEIPTSPRDRLIALSPTIRSALSRRFGLSYAAKTTEELAHDGPLGEVLGGADVETLIGILQTIDRLKFSASEIPDGESFKPAENLALWEAFTARVIQVIEDRRDGALNESIAAGRETRPSGE